jgi:RHS repeat-associated protein
MDGRRRVAVRRIGPAHPRDHGPRVQYHLGDHLGSSAVVVGGGDGAAAAAFVNREEYFPYGETSFGSFGRKCYRHNGLERDEESGLSYHGARYYAPWLMRWISPDPADDADGPNLFVAFSNNPLAYVDPSGNQSESAELQKQKVVHPASPWVAG